MDAEKLRKGLAKELRICRGISGDSADDVAENSGIKGSRLREIELAIGKPANLDELIGLQYTFGYTHLSHLIDQAEKWAKSGCLPDAREART